MRIKEKSVICPLDETIAVGSAKTDVAMKKKIIGWGLVDSIVYVTGTAKKAKVVTGDEHQENGKRDLHQTMRKNYHAGVRQYRRDFSIEVLGHSRLNGTVCLSGPSSSFTLWAGLGRMVSEMDC